ncbi:unnamed protein product [Penicillium nalgiovense]|nr:unnamed protein product [Penicillium nalgiovense]
MNDFNCTDTHREDLPKAPIAMAQVSNASKNDRPVQISATDGIPTAKRRNWSEAAGSQIETLNLGPVDRTSILEHLISNVRLQVGERYFSVLEEYDISRILEDSLSPVVKDICEQGKFDLNRHV